jgi:transposase-like protein
MRSHEDCLVYLEKIRWNGTPTCPYCGSTKSSAYKNEHRYRCQSCFTSYSVTVGTVFHQTHVDLGKWFLAIAMLHRLGDRISVRKLAQELQVTRSTATLMVQRIREVPADQVEILVAVVRSFEIPG